MSRSRLLGRLVLAFFITSVPLAAAGRAGADDPHQVPAFDMRDHHQAAAVGFTDQHEPLFASRVVGISNRDEVRIREGRRGFREPDTVLPKIGGRLLRVPGELETHSGI